MLRFGVAAMLAAFVWLAADYYAGQFFFASSSQIAANYAYKLFGWACMSAAVWIATPSPERRWPTILICGLALTVAAFEARMIALLTVASGANTFVGWIEALIAFALPAWLIWLWYKRASAPF
ncbi:MAG: hypothetical protein SGJ23_14005 [Alphaproteobacteria bacterium]|nr:hypothetical protein [Alphaproteobacteria bacterium]